MEIFTGQATLRSIETTNLTELIHYCQRLEAFQVSIGIPPTDPLIRFCIATYQVEGGVSWRGSACEWESWASALIHTIACMESLDMHAEKFLSQDLEVLIRIPLQDRVILQRITRAIRNLMYCRQAGKTLRSKRYDPHVLESDLGTLCINFLAAIPQGLRAQAIHDATEILSRRI